MKIEMGLFGFLTVIFVILKACGVIAWSWWWVFSPLWLHLVLVLALGCLIAAASFVLTIYNWFKRR